MALPTRMNAVLISQYGAVKDVVSMGSVPLPKLPSDDKHLLLRVISCSFNSADARVLNGSISFVVRPKFPYIPGADICGVVVDGGEKSGFQKGDVVMAGQDFPFGGMAEYTVVKTSHAIKLSKEVDPIQASGFPMAGLTALNAVRGTIKRGSRVLVIGGSSGVGSFVIQLAKSDLCGADYVAATSTNAALVQSIGADKVYNYREEGVFERIKQDGPFDTIVDCVGDHWNICGNTSGIAKPGNQGGLFIAVSANDTDFQLKSIWNLFGFMFSLLGTVMKTKIMTSKMPTFRIVSIAMNAKELSELDTLAASKSLRVLLDPCSPVPFTIDAIKNAMSILESHRAKGKIIVSIGEI